MLINKRNIQSELERWKLNSRRKPLIMKGARQVGKTTVIKEFAKSFPHQIFLNLESAEDRKYFKKGSNVKIVLDQLLIVNRLTFSDINKCILFIDEIQESPEAVRMLRYFYEDFPQLFVIAAGSLLEFELAQIKSFPVGRVEYLYMYPMNFPEFLEAIEYSNVLEPLHQIPVPAFTHDILLDLYNTYTIVGGMPEAVQAYSQKQGIADLARIYESIWGTYQSDVVKYTSSKSMGNVISHIISTAHLYLDQRIKFQNFGNSNYRSREVGEAFRLLDKAKIIQLIYPTTEIEPPIRIDLKKSPRIQFLDTGILNFSLNNQADLLVKSDLSAAYRGAIIQHLVTQEIQSLNTLREEKPAFWVREKIQSSAEVDLVYRYRNMIVPIEIKSGSTGTLKSLHQFIELSPHPYAVRVYGGKFSIEDHKTSKGKPYRLMNLPYYLATKLPEYIAYLCT